MVPMAIKFICLRLSHGRVCPDKANFPPGLRDASVDALDHASPSPLVSIPTPTSPGAHPPLRRVRRMVGLRIRIPRPVTSLVTEWRGGDLRECDGDDGGFVGKQNGTPCVMVNHDRRVEQATQPRLASGITALLTWCCRVGTTTGGSGKKHSRTGPPRQNTCQQVFLRIF